MDAFKALILALHILAIVVVLCTVTVVLALNGLSRAVERYGAGLSLALVRDRVRESGR